MQDRFNSRHEHWVGRATSKGYGRNMDAQRALLDELMGRNRDGDKPEEEVSDFRDARVCKRFLCGLCPHDLFQNTKMDLGECAKLHLPKLKTAYEKDPRAKEYGYENELEKDLVKIISEVERKIARSQTRLEEQEGERAPSLMDVENSKEVLEITAQIQEMMQKAEEAGNDGEVDLSMELMAQVEELQAKKAEMQANVMVRTFKPVVPEGEKASENGETKAAPLGPGANVNQKLRVCDVCGAFLSIFDSDRRLADHFGGKLHLGYLQIRKKIEQIAEERRERRRARGGAPSPPRADRRDGGQGADRERRRDHRSRSRSRSRREQHSSRRDRDRSRDRSRDRGRDSSRRRHRRRSTSRSRSRSRGRRH